MSRDGSGIIVWLFFWRNFGNCYINRLAFLHQPRCILIGLLIEKVN